MDNNTVRQTLGLILGVTLLNALGGGLYGLQGAAGVPTDWLAGTPFRNYFIPSVILLFVVGGALLVATLAVFEGWPRARFFALGAAFILLSFIATETVMIGYVSWLQPVTAAVGIVIVLLARRLPRPKYTLGDALSAPPLP